MKKEKEKKQTRWQRSGLEAEPQMPWWQLECVSLLQGWKRRKRRDNWVCVLLSAQLIVGSERRVASEDSRGSSVRWTVLFKVQSTLQVYKLCWLERTGTEERTFSCRYLIKCPLIALLEQPLVCKCHRGDKACSNLLSNVLSNVHCKCQRFSQFKNKIADYLHHNGLHSHIGSHPTETNSGKKINPRT